MPESRQAQPEAESLQKSRIAEESQASQAEKSVSSKRKNPDKINLNKAEQEVREAITNSKPYDLESIAKKHNVLMRSFQRRLQRNGLIGKRKHLSHKESKRRCSLAWLTIEALRDAKQPFVWSNIAKMFNVKLSTLLLFRDRVTTHLDHAIEAIKQLNSSGAEHSLTDIAHHCEIKIGYLSQALRKLGLKTPSDLAVEKIKTFIRDDQAFSQSDIAKRFNISDGTLSRALKANGINCKKRKIL